VVPFDAVGGFAHADNPLNAIAADANPLVKIGKTLY